MLHTARISKQAHTVILIQQPNNESHFIHLLLSSPCILDYTYCPTTFAFTSASTSVAQLPCCRSHCPSCRVRWMFRWHRAALLCCGICCCLRARGWTASSSTCCRLCTTTVVAAGCYFCREWRCTCSCPCPSYCAGCLSHHRREQLRPNSQYRFHYELELLPRMQCC